VYISFIVVNVGSIYIYIFGTTASSGPRPPHLRGL
jgi:hypothetical protein